MSAPTIYDIAARAGVGIATVSRVINGSRRVSDKTRGAVQQAMDELGFRPNHAARRLAAGAPHRSRVVALMPFFTTAFYFSVCKAISKVLSEADTDFVLLDVHDQKDADRQLDRLIAERSCEGVILCSMDLTEERHDQFSTLKIPVVALDCNSKFVPHVRVDNEEGGRLLSQTLSTHGSQHQALILGTRGALVFREREAGFRQVAPPSFRVFETENVDVASGARIAEEILESFPEVDGVACVGDPLAIGATKTLREHGRRVPQDVQVMGFDDQPLMAALGLTTIRQPMEELGTWAADTIVRLISTPNGGPPQDLILPLEVIERDTTGRLG